MILSFKGLELVDYCGQRGCLVFHYENGLKVNVYSGSNVRLVD